MMTGSAIETGVHEPSGLDCTVIDNEKSAVAVFSHARDYQLRRIIFVISENMFKGLDTFTRPPTEERSTTIGRLLLVQAGAS